MLYRLIQVSIGLLLVYAAYTKTQNIPMFAFVLQQSVPFMSGLSTEWLFKVVHVVVFVECAIGLALVVRLFDTVIRWVATVMFVGFTLILIGMMFRDQPLSCGCLGISPNGLGSRAQLLFGIARNGFLIALLIFISYQMIPRTIEAACETRT